MALSIKDEETDALVRRLAKARNVSYTAAIKLAVSNELDREAARPRKDADQILASIKEVQERIARIPEIRSSDEVDAWLYDENGLPH